MKQACAYLLVTAIVAAGAGLASTRPAGAASALNITAMDCAKHPGLFDVIYITNNGDASQDLAGWQLRSDPRGKRADGAGSRGCA